MSQPENTEPTQNQSNSNPSPEDERKKQFEKMKENSVVKLTSWWKRRK